MTHNVVIIGGEGAPVILKNAFQKTVIPTPDYIVGIYRKGYGLGLGSGLRLGVKL